MAVWVNLGSIKVGGMTNDSGIYIGQNMQNGWDSHAKNNTGIGEITGDYNWLGVYMAILYDPDVIDAPIFDNDIKSPSLAHIQGV